MGWVERKLFIKTNYYLPACPPLTLIPSIRPELVPPPSEICPPQFEKKITEFYNNFDNINRLKDCVKKLYFMLKTLKISQFWSQGIPLWVQ